MPVPFAPESVEFVRGNALGKPCKTEDDVGGIVPEEQGIQDLPYVLSVVTMKIESGHEWQVTAMKWRECRMVEFSNGRFLQPDALAGFKPLRDWSDVEIAGAIHRARKVLTPSNANFPDGCKLEFGGACIVVRMPLSVEDESLLLHNAE